MKFLSDIDKIDKSKWSDFVKCHPQGTVFQTPEMYEVYENTPNNTPVLLCAVDERGIVGILLAVIMTNNSKMLKTITARSIIIGGPLVINYDRSIFMALLKEYCKIIPKHVVYSEIRPMYDMSSWSDSIQSQGFARHGHYNVTIPLERTEEELYKSLKKERRKHISQAVRLGLTFKQVEKQEDIETVINLIKETYRRKHVPLTDTIIFLNGARFMPRFIRFFVVCEGDAIIAGQVALCYKEMVYAWYTGSSEKSLKLRPNDLLMWSFILWANEKGYKVFDFGGGGEPGVPYGVRDYKLTFGSELTEYGRYVKLHRPFIYKTGKRLLSFIMKK